MDLLDLITKIIGNKFFILLLGIGLAFAIPTTWHNATAVPQWWTIAVFIVNILSVFFCCFKFVSMLMAKKEPNIQQEKW